MPYITTNWLVQPRIFNRLPLPSSLSKDNFCLLICLLPRSLLHMFRWKKQQCKIVGCSTKPEPISDVCKQLRSEYASSGRVQLGVFAIVRYNHDPIISDKGDWWPTQKGSRIKLREVCYEGIELETIASRILESVRKQSSQE